MACCWPFLSSSTAPGSVILSAVFPLAREWKGESKDPYDLHINLKRHALSMTD
jgi:hypothetical protein